MTSITTPPEQPFQVTSAADILSYVLHTLGFQPAESLVLLTMCGKRVGATLRVDLPDEDVDPGDYAAGVCSILASPPRRTAPCWSSTRPIRGFCPRAHPGRSWCAA
ncbi:DUF4192 family protein [Arthrobacter sp. Hz1]